MKKTIEHVVFVAATLGICVASRWAAQQVSEPGSSRRLAAG
jgi:hypothetical protein